jgi:hypothetical protein
MVVFNLDLPQGFPRICQSQLALVALAALAALARAAARRTWAAA